MAERSWKTVRSSQYAYLDTLVRLVRPGVRWLDVGCGRGIFPRWMRRHDRSVVPDGSLLVGIDMDFSSLVDNTTVMYRVVGDMEHAPFRSESFDLITANMVMEHVEDPRAALGHVHRLLKPGGLLIFHTPNYLNYQFIVASLLPQRLKNALVWYLEGRRDEDVFPTRYRLNTARTIRRLARECGFDIVALDLINSSPVMAPIGFLAYLEVVGMRVLDIPPLRVLRSNIIAVLQRVECDSPTDLEFRSAAEIGPTPMQNPAGTRACPQK